MTQKTEANFMTTKPRKQDYGTVDALSVFHWRAPTLDTEEDYNRDLKIWDKNLTAGIKQWKEYVNNGEYLFLAIQGQVEPSLWDKTKGNAQFVAIQTLKCLIELINLMKERSTKTMHGVWQPLALMSQFQQTVQNLQNPICGGSKPIGDYKQEVESFVETTAQLGGLFPFSATLMEPILTDAGETLVTYLTMDVANQSPYDILYKDYIVTIIIAKNYGYKSLRKWLSQQHMAPQGLAYPTSSNELVEMMNSGNYEPDPYKSKSKQNNRKNNKNKNKDDKEEEIVGAIVEPTKSIPDTPPTDPNLTEQESDSDTSSKGDDSSEEDNEEADIRRVFALVNSELYGDDDLFDPESQGGKTLC